MNRPSRYIGVLVTAALLAAGAYVYFSGPSGGGVRGPAAPPATPGGQIVATLRSEPRSYNRMLVRDYASEMLNILTQGRLVRINRATFELEPWLAERWESSADGRTHTLHLRRGVSWSDGMPFTSADVLFSFRALYDESAGSVITGGLLPGGEPIRAAAPDDHTVVLAFAAPVGPGIGLLDIIPILPKHALEPALTAGTFAKAWSASTPPAEIVGLGPFVVRDYQPGQRFTFERNPHYWRTAADGTRLPYLERVILEIVPDQNAELLRLQSGAADLTTTELRHEDYVPIRRAEEAGTLELVELGVSTDADAFWFCLDPAVKGADPRFAFVREPAFRQAISHAVDREAFAQDVFLGEAVPIWGPITPGNRPWFTPDLPRYAPDDSRARQLLRGLGLEDRNGNGVVEDANGTEARFTVITQRGVTYYERGTAVLREQLAEVGIALDIAALEVGALGKLLVSCDYDAMYMRPLATDLDPAANLDFWLSSGEAHLWHMQQESPATPWEAEIDRLMREQAQALDPGRRRELFAEVQAIFAEQLPVLYFAAPRLFTAHSTRLLGVVPSVMRPQVLWSADTLSVADAPGR